MENMSASQSSCFGNNDLSRFLKILNDGKCPYTKNITDVSYLSELLFTPSSQRTKILMWLLCRIDIEIAQMIQRFQEKHPLTFHASDNPTKLYIFLCDIVSSFGLCSCDDVELIRGKSKRNRQFIFWDRLLSFLSTSDEYENACMNDVLCEMNSLVQEMIIICHPNQFFINSMKVVSPIIQKEIAVLRKSKWSLLIGNVSTEKVSNHLHDVQTNLKEFEDIDIEKRMENVSNEDSSTIERIIQSIIILLNDLHQISVAFNATYDNNIKLICKTNVLEFSALGKVAYNVNSQLQEFLKFVRGLNNIKTAEEVISSQPNVGEQLAANVF